MPDWVNAAGGIGLANNKTAKSRYLPVVGLQVGGDVISAYPKSMPVSVQPREKPQRWMQSIAR